jgi:hypothetical protein
MCDVGHGAIGYFYPLGNHVLPVVDVRGDIIALKSFEWKPSAAEFMTQDVALKDSFFAMTNHTLMR